MSENSAPEPAPAAGEAPGDSAAAQAPGRAVVADEVGDPGTTIRTATRTKRHEATSGGAPPRPWRRRLTPYLLLAPALIYLAMFFAYPMLEAGRLAVRDDEAKLPLIESPTDSNRVGELPKGTQVEIIGQQGVPVAEGDNAEFVAENWYLIEGDGVSGWIPESRLRVRDESTDGEVLGGTIRPNLSEGAGTTTEVFESALPGAAVVGEIQARAEVTVTDTQVLEVWFQVRSTEGSAITGWAPSRTIDVFASETDGRVQTGTVGEFTSKYLSSMVDDSRFWPALRTTLLLMLLILPVQFVLALVMALVINARLRFASGFLYVFTLPMGMSDLAAGILFFSIFTGNGFLNSFLQGVGLIDSPAAFLTADTRGWIIFAIVIAEVWRATSIVMVILVSGLQAIPSETLEAAELFGASYWQRVRHIVLPLLRPSIQVALILRTILAFQVFAVVVALSGGEIVTVLANETYRQYFDLRNNHVASAYALFILLLSMASAVLYLRSVRTESEGRSA